MLPVSSSGGKKSAGTNFSGAIWVFIYQDAKLLPSSVTVTQNTTLTASERSSQKNKKHNSVSFAWKIAACICIHTQKVKQIRKHVLRHTHTSAAIEGFIPRLLESDISMALSGVSMAILCTEMKRGDTRLGPGSQREQIYISSRAVKAPPLSVPLLSCFSVTVCVTQPPLPASTTPSSLSQKNTFHPCLSLWHTQFS